MKKKSKSMNMVLAAVMLMAFMTGASNGATRLTQNISLEKWKTFWVIVSGNPTLCVPAVAFLFKNVGTVPLGSIILNATFLNPVKKVVFSTGNHWVNSNGQIPPGYSYAGMVYGNIGYIYGLGGCASAMPKLTVDATVEDFNGGPAVNALQNAPVYPPKNGGMYTYYLDQPQDTWVRNHIFK